MIISHVDENLRISLDSFIEDAERSRFEIVSGGGGIGIWHLAKMIVRYDSVVGVGYEQADMYNLASFYRPDKYIISII